MSSARDLDSHQPARVETREPAGSPYAAVLWDMDGTLVDTEP
jgi:hypothetical protein